MKHQTLVRLILLTWLALTAHSAIAQDPLALSVELIDNRLTAMREAAAPADSPALLAYEESRQLLVQAESLDQEAANFMDSLATAPEREQEIQARIDALDSEYNPAAGLDGLSQDELSTRLAETRVRQRELTSQVEALDRRLAARENIATTIRERLAAIDQQLEELPEAAVSINREGTPSELEATQWRNVARARALNAENQAREAQLESQPMRYSAMAAERAELALNLERVNTLIRVLESRTSQTVGGGIELVDIGIDEQDPVYPVAEYIYRQEDALRQELVSVSGRLTVSRAQNTAISERQRALDDRQNTARRIVDFAGDSESLGTVLLTYWDESGNFALDDPTVQLSRDVGSAVIRRINLEEELTALVSVTGFVNSRLRQEGLEPDSISTENRQILLELARGYRERLRGVIAELSQFIDALSELDANYSQFSRQYAEYRNFLQGLVLWIPNHPPLWSMSVDEIPRELHNVYNAVLSLKFSFGPMAGLYLLIAIGLTYYRRRLKNFQLGINKLIARPRDDSIWHTARSGLAALLRSMPAPLILLALSGTLDPENSSISYELVSLLVDASMIVFIFRLLQVISEPKGIGTEHFDWDVVAMERLHREMRFVLNIWVPLALFAGVLTGLTPNTGEEVIGRLALLFVLLVLGIHFLRMRAEEENAAQPA